MSTPNPNRTQPLGLFIQPACLQHKYIRHANSSHIFERPERLRAVLLGVAAAIARLEEFDRALSTIVDGSPTANGAVKAEPNANPYITPSNSTSVSGSAPDDLSKLLSGLSINHSFVPPTYLNIVPPPIARIPGQILLHHPALQLAHSPPPEGSLHEASNITSSAYLKDLYKWASEAVERIKETGCEIPGGLGLNQGDLYLGPGSILAIEGAIQTVCQAIDKVCAALDTSLTQVPVTPPAPKINDPQTTPPNGSSYFDMREAQGEGAFNKAFCAIRPPGHHCGEDLPSGFCYVNNVVVGALHAYLEHDIDRAIIIDFDLHHGNGTQALVMPLNAASHAEDLAIKAGKPNPPVYGSKGKRRRGWKSFYGSVHDIYSYPCEDGDVDLIKDASISLAAHGQYIENIHLQPYSSEADFYERIYPKYLKLLDKARNFMEETQAEADRTIVLISAGFDACEHEHQGMQRHDRRVPVSFFSRYTRDIVAFANQYTEGKVVSVLEGGYSDRALTSASLGHIVGLLDREGERSWWTEAELINIEKATKKKRTGKIAPFPSELTSVPHLIRTHALLAHFEGTSLDTVSAAPSAANTPQPGSRMTLRDRKKATNYNYTDEDMSVTPPARKAAARGRAAAGAAQNGSTPRSKLQNPSTSSAAVTPNGKKVQAGVERDVVLGEPAGDDERQQDSLVATETAQQAAYPTPIPVVASLPRIPAIASAPSVHSDGATSAASSSQTTMTTARPSNDEPPSLNRSSAPISGLPTLSGGNYPYSIPTTSHPAAYAIPTTITPGGPPPVVSSSETVLSSQPTSAPSSQNSQSTQPRIILRIPRIPSGRTSPQLPSASDLPQYQAPAPATAQPVPVQMGRIGQEQLSQISHLYPSLPTSILNPASGGPQTIDETTHERMAYREGSVATTSTEGEYQSAASELSDIKSSEGERERREHSSSSAEIPMPGKFGV